MSYVAIPSNLKHVNSISLELMSPEETLKMSYGEVLTAETINYRTGAPQMNGLFCQAIFGPVKNWECACGKYKRYRYAGVICDKCGVEVTHSSVRRERMGHITLAAPCAHPWFFRIIPSRVSLLLDMKTTDIARIIYFSAYVITEINQNLRDEYIERIDKEAQSRVKMTESEFDDKFEKISRQYQIDKSKSSKPAEDLKIKYESDKELLKEKKREILAKIETIGDIAKKEITSLKLKDVITEMQYQELAGKFGPVFKANIGAEAVQSLLAEIDLDKQAEDLEAAAMKSRGNVKRKLVKRLKLVKHFVRNNTKPEWMILHRIMVLPPELRPMLQLNGGRFATSDLNELYRRLVNRNNRLRKLIQIGAPEVILRNEKRMLQEAVEALMDNSARGGKQVMASTGIRRPLKSLTHVLKGKQGRFRQNLLGKRVDYSGRSVIVVGPKLQLDQCGIPKMMALELFTPFLIGQIIQRSENGELAEEKQAFNVHSARRLIENKDPLIYDLLEDIIKDRHVLLNRAPTLHKLSFMAFKPTLVEGKAIQLHPLVCTAFNADFDGDQMAVHLPITIKGQEEAANLMVSTKNLLKPATGELIMAGHQEIVLGAYYLTIPTKELNKREDMKYFANTGEALLSYENGLVELGEMILTRVKGEEGLIETTPGRIIFNRSFPKEAGFVNKTLNKKGFNKLLNEMYHKLGAEAMPDVLNNIKNRSFKYVTQSGITLSTFDMVQPKGKDSILEEARDDVSEAQSLFDVGLMTNEDRYNVVVKIWIEAGDKITKLVEDAVDPTSNVGLMINSGSRGNISQLNQMAGIKGLSVSSTGRVMELPAQHGFIDGLTSLEYFLTTKGGRKAQADISLKTADSGYLTRRLVDVAQNLVVSTQDCGTEDGKLLTEDNSKKLGKTVWERAYGRYVVKDVKLGKKVIVKAGDLIDHVTFNKYKNDVIKEVEIFSVNKCISKKGVSVKCYGADFATHKPVKLGTAVGVIAAQSLGEPSTQLTMRSKHTGGVLTKSDITSGLPRVEELFEARNPKVVAPMADFPGVVEKVDGSVAEGHTITISRRKATQTIPFDSNTNIIIAKDGDRVKSGDVVMIEKTGMAIMCNLTGDVEITKDSLKVKADEIDISEYSIDSGLQLLIKEGQEIKKGDKLAEGHLVLQDVLDRLGIDMLEEYIIQELHAIYASNGIDVNEKHIEIIVRKMTGKVQILDHGESEFTIGDMVSRVLVVARNIELLNEGKKPVIFKPIVAGISKASLSTESFLSAASFQETSRVLVEAVLSGRKDNLTGLKENVILGQLIPAGTGFDEQKFNNNTSEDLEEEFEEGGDNDIV